MNKTVLLGMLGLMLVVFLTLSATTFASTLPADELPSTPDLVIAATLKPSADSFVRNDYPNTNYGSYPEVRAQSSPLLIGYLKFTVSGLTSPVTKATLRLYSLRAVSSGYKVYRVTSNSWSEGSINYSNSPALGSFIGASGAVNADDWTSVDVTSYVTGNGTYSFGLTDPSSTMIRLASRESSSSKPKLVIETGSASIPPPTPAPNPTSTPVPPPPPTNLLWSANMETGDLNQWNNGGGEFNSGNADSVASRDVARSGSWSVKMTATTPPESGTRLFRWTESRTYGSLYYSTWFYFPRNYSAPNYWNIFQWKSKVNDSIIDPFYVLNVGNRGDGSMYLYLYDWQRKNSVGSASINVPVGRWMHIEAFYKCTPDNNGQVTIWQDGTQIINHSGRSTRYSNGDCQWSINNYSSSLSPSPAAIYADDAAISQSWIP